MAKQFVVVVYASSDQTENEVIGPFLDESAAQKYADALMAVPDASEEDIEVLPLATPDGAPN